MVATVPNLLSQGLLTMNRPSLARYEWISHVPNREQLLMNKQAAIAWAAAEPLSVENVEVAPPKAHEVRIKILHTGVCHTGEFEICSKFRGLRLIA